MEVYMVGYNQKYDKYFSIERPNGTNTYTFILTQTSGTFILDGKEYDVPPGSFIFYNAYYPQYFKANGETYIHNWIHFLVNENDDYIFNQGIEMNKFYYLNNVTNITQIFELLNQEFYSQNKYKDLSVKLYFDLILTKIREKIDSASTSVNLLYKEDFDAIRADIYNFPAKNWTVKKMAGKVGLSESHFQHLYKEQFGTSVITDVINSRIKTAKLLLITTSKSLSAIAVELGYNSTSLFIRQFKSATSLTPGVYRKNNKIYDHVYSKDGSTIKEY